MAAKTGVRLWRLGHGSCGALRRWGGDRRYGCGIGDRLEGEPVKPTLLYSRHGGIAAAVAVALFVSACSGDDRDATEPADDTTVTTATTANDATANDATATETTEAENPPSTEPPPSEAPATTAPPDSQPTVPASITTETPASPQDVQVTVDCSRGELLSELDVDLSRVTFVPDDASDETAWITVDVTVENPTAEWIQVDPGFNVAFFDADGTEIATQPWIDPTYGPVYADIAATSQFLVQPGQISTSRIVVFAGFSGPLVLREAQPRLLESLDSCQLGGVPNVEAAAPFAPPPGVTLELTGCAANVERTRVVAELTASNDTDQDIALDVTAEVVDSEGNRIGAIGTFETPLSLGASTTVTTELIGNAAYMNTDSIATCNLYAAVPTRR